MDKFYVGAKVIAIRNHSTGGYKKGDIREVLQIRKASCKCDDLDLDLGFKIRPQFRQSIMVCQFCDMEILANGIQWCGSGNWRLLPEEELSETTVDEILDEILANN